MHLIKKHITLCLVILMGTQIMSSGLRQWELAASFPGETLYDVCWGEGRFIAIGGLDIIYYSSDGVNWSEGDYIGGNYRKVIYQQGMYFAMGPSGIQRSLDGISWTNVSSTTTSGISCHEGILVAVGSNGNIQRSLDKGLTWQSQTSGTSRHLFSTTYWRGRFYVVGENQTILSSTIGSSWSLYYQDSSEDYFKAIIPWEEDLLALGDNNVIFQSTNGSDWFITTSQGYDKFPSSILKTKDFGSFLSSTFSQNLSFTSDGNYWSYKSMDLLPLGTDPIGLATNGHIWIVVTDANEIYISKPDHSTRWLDLQQADDFHYKDVIWDGKQYVAVGSGGKIGISVDGAHWKLQSIPGVFIFTGIGYDNGTYVAVGAFGHVWISSDAVTWGRANSGTTKSLSDVGFNGTTWLAIGQSGTAITATNPASWSVESTGTTQWLNALTSRGFGSFWVVGDNGTCVIRGAMGSWHSNNLPTASVLNDVVGTGPTEHWVVGRNGTLYKHNSTWFSMDSETSEHLNAIDWSEEHGLTFAGTNGILKRNGVFLGSFTHLQLNAIASNSLSQLVVGNNGSCGKSAPTAFAGPETVREYTHLDNFGYNGDIVWTGEVFVALYMKNRIATSTDGRIWEDRSVLPNLTSPNTYSDLHWDGQKLYVVSKHKLLESLDFTTWTAGTQYFLFFMRGMTSHAGQLVVSCRFGEMAYGPDINNLTSATVPGVAVDYEEVIWNGLRYVTRSINRYAHSIDGVTWSSAALPDVGSDRSTSIISRGNGETIITTDGNTYYSEDGTGFEKVGYAPIECGTWTGDAFIGLGEDGLMEVSADGKYWESVDLGYTIALDNIAFNGREIVASGQKDFFVDRVLRFPLASGYQWGKRKVQSNSDTYGLAFNGKRYVSVGVSGRVHVSGNGIDWCEADSATGNALNDVEWIGDRFLAVGNYGKIVSSPDGIDWTQKTSGTTSHLKAVACDGMTALAGGRYGRIYRSTNKGEGWALVAELSEDVSGLTWKGGTWVAVGNNGMIETSADGMIWQPQTSGTSSGLKDICQTKYGFLAVGYQGTILESEDGVTWDSRPFPVTQILYTVETFGDRIMIGSSDGIWTGSYDLWSFHQVYSGDKIEALLRNEQWVAVGEKGTITVSTWGTSPDKPLVTADDDDIQACVGSDVTMRVNRIGSPSYSYRWFKGAVELSPGTNHYSTFTINSFDASDEGQYSCRVWKEGGMVEVFFTLTSAGGFGGEIEQHAYVQGIDPISMMALVNCETNPIDFTWTDLGSQQTFGNGNNPATLPSSVVSSTTVEVSVTDTVTQDIFQDTALILIADDPLFFNLNGDSCNDINDLYDALEEWRQPSSLDANSDGVFNLLDFLYINLDGCD